MEVFTIWLLLFSKLKVEYIIIYVISGGLMLNYKVQHNQTLSQVKLCLKQINTHNSNTFTFQDNKITTVLQIQVETWIQYYYLHLYMSSRESINKTSISILSFFLHHFLMAATNVQWAQDFMPSAAATFLKMTN